MKKITLLFLSMFIALAGLNAQSFKKSDKFVEGTLSYAKTEGADATYSISPTFGYFLSDKFAIGVTGEVGSSEDGDVTNVGAFARYYFLEIGKNFKGFTDFTVGSNTTKSDNVKVSSFNINAGLGANYFISKRVALSARISEILSYSSSEGSSSFALGFNGFTNPFAMGSFGILLKL